MTEAIPTRSTKFEQAGHALDPPLPLYTTMAYAAPPQQQGPSVFQKSEHSTVLAHHYDANEAYFFTVKYVNLRVTASPR